MPIARNIITVGGATLLSRLLGFLRDAGIAALLGAGVLSDAFFVALQIPNLFRRLLAEGALNSAFVPIWIRIRDEGGTAATRRFGEEILSVALLGLGTLAILCMLFAPDVMRVLAPGFGMSGDRHASAVEFIRLSVSYIAIAGLVAIAASILNAEGRVGATASGIVVFNAVLVAAVAILLISGIPASARRGAILSAVIVLAGLGQFLLVGGAMLRLDAPPIRPRFMLSANTRHFFAQAGPGLIAGGIPQLKLMAGAMVASTSQASVSWLYYANRLYELPLGVVSIVISAVMVPAIAASIRTENSDFIASAQSRALEIAIGLALPSAAAFAILAETITSGLFQRGAFGPHDSAAVASALAAISAGLPGHILEKVLGAISFAHEDTRTPMLAAATGLAAATAGALMLFPTYGHVGIAAAIAISGWVGAVLMSIILVRRRWLKIGHDTWRRLSWIVLAAIVMSLAILAARASFASIPALSASPLARIGTLALLVTIGLAVYIACLQSFGVARLRDIIVAVRYRS